MESEIVHRTDNTISASQGTFRDYLALARFDHSTKHIFIAPGFALAYLLRGDGHGPLVPQVILGLVMAISIASANYVINEYLDRDFDRHHPTKSNRPAVRYVLRGKAVFFEWLGFVAIGLSAGLAASQTMFVVACAFGLQGIIYNVPPLRSKDKAVLDVISESVNNPIRLVIGWAMVDPATLPPSSIILSYWLAGAFLMGAKRYSEYREIGSTTHGRDLLVRYRASFAGYSEDSLIVSCFVYGLLSTFFLAVFLVKYRVEYVLLAPATVWLFAHYLIASMQPHSVAQNPEGLFRDLGIVVLVVAFSVLFVVATWIDMPFLSVLLGQRYISLN